jgi:thioesterase domain-containing protein
MSVHLEIELLWGVMHSWLSSAGSQLQPSFRSSVLFRAAQQVDGSRDLGWQKRLPNIEVVDVAGGHHSMFEDGNLQELCDQVVAAIERSDCV